MIESTQSLGNDLAGVMALQRKLTGMERDLEAIQVWTFTYSNNHYIANKLICIFYQFGIL